MRNVTPLMKILFFVAVICLPICGHAQSAADNDAKPSSAAEELKLLKVPPGFEVQLVADETQIQKPTNIAFDAAGRLWVTGSELYPWATRTDAVGQTITNFEKEWSTMSGSIGAKKPEPPPAAIDTVRVLSAFGPDGRAQKVEVFADKLNIPIGIQPMPRKPGAKGDTAIVFSIPTIWRMEDTDGDGRADVREALYTGFGFRDTHGMSASYYYWIDGWIYGTHGFANHSEVRDREGHVTVLDSGNTYRFRADGSRFEIHTHGQTNPFGLAFDPLGNLYSADSHSKPVYMLIRGGYYEGIGKQHDGLGFAPRITDDDHGSSAIAGVAYYADEKFPEEFRGNLFNGNPVTRRINRDRIEWHGSTPQAIRMPDFLTSEDPWFRPVQVKLGPDGALWIADFYNPIIGHYEVPLLDPRRDHTHGRIWRVVWTGGETTNTLAQAKKKEAVPPRAESSLSFILPDLTKLDGLGLMEKLGSANLLVRVLATNELVERRDKNTVERLRSLFVSQPQGAHALWALERMGELRDDMLWKAMGVEFDKGRPFLVPAAREMRVHGLRILCERGRLGSIHEDVARLALHEKNPTVQRVAAELVSSHFHWPPGELARLARLWNQTAEDDVELRYALRMTMRDSLPRAGDGFGTDMLSDGQLPANEARIVADVCLGAPTAESAMMLVHYLERTKLSELRSGEFVRHVVLHLPQERIEAVNDLIELIKEAPLGQRLNIADNVSRAVRERGIKLPAKTSLWSEHVILEALGSPEESVLKRAIESVRELKSEEKFEPLVHIVQDQKRSGPIRMAALEAMANTDRANEALTASLNDVSSMTLRKRAAELLGQMTGNKKVEQTLLAALSTAPWELGTTIAAGLAKNDTSCGALLALIESGKASAALLRNKTVAAPLGQRSAALKDRATILTKDLPPEDARLDAVIAQRVNEYRTAQPDPAHGALVFQQQCAVCHKVKNAGANIGPNLDGVGARGLHRLLEDILDPNRNVDPVFAQTIIETTDGQMLAGVGPRTEGQLIVMNDAQGKPISVPRSNVKSQTQSRLSLMPPIFEQLLSGKDLNDLVAYLLSQTSSAN